VPHQGQRAGSAFMRQSPRGGGGFACRFSVRVVAVVRGHGSRASTAASRSVGRSIPASS